MPERYRRPEEALAELIRENRRGTRDSQRATGTEKALTTEVAQQAWDQSEFAKQLAEQLETDLGPLPGQVQEALAEAAAALAEAGLARSDAASAVADAQAAVAEAEQAILDAADASAAAGAAQSAANAAQSTAGAAQDAADQAAQDALSAATAAGVAQATANAKGKTIIQSAAPAAADRLPQNLWIDTTGGANTPKRWNGTAWEAVTDKAATDAAAAAVTAQNRADAAFSEAVDAATAAGSAMTTANGKNRVWYQGTEPSGTGHRVDDVWFNTAQGNRMARWTGSAWAVVEFGGAALANSAVNTAKLADDAVTSAKIALEAVGNDELAAVVKGAITTAQSTATAAQGTANTAQSNANQALADAAAAAGIAGGKADVLIQSTAPAAAMRKATTLWIDTTGGANTPKRWTTGTTWVAVTDKVATDAAANAATAQSVASGAASAASAAQSAANAAQLAADAAQSTANGRAVVVRSTSAATAAGSYKLGDQWWQFSGANITGLWLHDGTAWVSQALTNAIIATLDAGKITTGFLAAARIQAATITGTHIAGGTVTAANMVAGTITAASGIIANAAIGSAQIIDLAVSSAKIADLAVTNAKIADATIQNAKIADLDAAKITTGTLNAARIASNAITTDKIAALAVTAAEIAANAVTAVKIAANAVTAEKINAGAVTTDKLDALAVTAAKIAAGAIIADKIAAGAITTAKLAATAIDGMTITGALIRTAASGQRLELDANGLRAFNAANAVVGSLKSDTGGLLLAGALTSYPGGNSQRAILSNGALSFDHVGSPGAGTMTLGPGGISSADSNARMMIEKKSSAPGVGITLTAGSGGGDTATILMSGANGGSISFLASQVDFPGDASGLFTPGAGWSILTSHDHRLTRVKNICYLQVTLVVGGGAQLSNLGTVPVGFRPVASSNAGTAISSGGKIGSIRVLESGVIDLIYTTVTATGTYVPISAVWQV